MMTHRDQHPGVHMGALTSSAWRPRRKVAPEVCTQHLLTEIAAGKAFLANLVGRLLFIRESKANELEFAERCSQER